MVREIKNLVGTSSTSFASLNVSFKIVIKHSLIVIIVINIYILIYNKIYQLFRIII